MCFAARCGCLQALAAAAVVDPPGFDLQSSRPYDRQRPADAIDPGHIHRARAPAPAAERHERVGHPRAVLRVTRLRLALEHERPLLPVCVVPERMTFIIMTIMSTDGTADTVAAGVPVSPPLFC